MSYFFLTTIQTKMEPDIVVKFYSICGLMPKYNSLTRKFEKWSLNTAALLVILLALNVWFLYSIIRSRMGLEENLVNLSLAFNHLYVFTTLLTVIFPTFRGFQMLLIEFCKMDSHLRSIGASAVDLKRARYTCLAFIIGQFAFAFFYWYHYTKMSFELGIAVPINNFCVVAEIYLEYYILARIVLGVQSLNGFMARCANKIQISNVRGIAKVYTVGCDVVESFNEVFGGLVFLQIVSTYLNVVAVLYENLSNPDKINWVLIIGENFNFLFAFALLIYKSERIKSEMSKSVVLANKIIQNSIDDKSIQHLLWMLGHETTSRQPRISAAGVFELGYPLVFTLVNLTVTYVIVMYQVTLS